MAFSKPLLFVVLFFSFKELVTSTELGFNAKLVHRDSQLSPFYNGSDERFDRVIKGIRRSFSRYRRFGDSVSSSSYSTALYDNAGAMLMKISIGTPATTLWGFADTGSALVWTQCQPCVSCNGAPIFNPQSSGSYKTAPCAAPACQNAGYVSCGAASQCQYTYTYGDRTFSSGELATEVLTFPNGPSFPGFYFGCGTDNEGVFSPQESGIFGLGNGPISLINQLNITMFSYCLPDATSQVQSTISFGPNAAVTGSNVLSTPILTQTSNSAPFYYLTLTAFKIGSTTIRSTISGQKGNILIDSGTTLTFLPSDFVNGIVTQMKRAITCKRNTALEQQLGLALCYQTSPGNCFSSVPPVVAVFDGGSLTLPSENTFVPVSSRAQCLTFVGRSGPSYIWGITTQLRFRVGYDLANLKLNIQPTPSC